jgi:hypothetical protein
MPHSRCLITKQKEKRKNMATVAGVRRNRPGTSAADFNAFELIPPQSREGVLAVHELVQQQIRAFPDRPLQCLQVPSGVSELAWQLEHMRQFVSSLGALSVALNAVCTAASCPMMRATDEWLYLCAAHTPPRECKAIDYQLHTLDGSAATLTSQQSFPSRYEFFCRIRLGFLTWGRETA